MTNSLFDAIAYLQGLARKNKLARKEKFFPCTCSGINTLQEVIENFRRASSFFAVDDTSDGVTMQKNGGYFHKRTFTVFLLKKYSFMNMKERQAALDTCRSLFKQIHSRLIKDTSILEGELVGMDVDKIFSREIGTYFLQGCTGVYFMIEFEEPVNLEYHVEEWDD